MIDWLADVWSRAASVQIADGGEDAGPIATRTVLAEIRDPAALAELRSATTTGSFTGDICRCHGSRTLVLRDAAGEVIAHASLHGYDTVSWERRRFRDDLIIAHPASLHLLLAAQGVPGQIVQFYGPLTDLLQLHEGRPQFRPAGEKALRHLADRKVPEVLRPVLASMTGQEAGGLSDEQVGKLRRLLVGHEPSPTRRAEMLLGWLGRLSVPAEALWGEGVLVRQLLADIASHDIATAADDRRTGHIAMGIINLVQHNGDDRTLTSPIVPILRELFGNRRPGGGASKALG
ncbi:hypothetical protein AB0M47_22595 [Hamadaea sp. NPDC051192]|uniref:hypothetical protein n=1 Tax=Hamadaea sp. NPDC051192 TaxID=3154940 RepID=UPI00343CD278